MTVTPIHANLFQERKELYQFLLHCKETLREKSHSKIVSISVKSQPVDPLVVLEKIGEPNKLHFYIERPHQGEAIAAIDAAIKLKLKGSDRFLQAQAFISSCLDNTTATGDLHLPFSGPHFFCSFTFFEDSLTANSPFDAATVFLPRWQVSCRQECSAIVANIVIDLDVNLERLIAEITHQYKLIKASVTQPIQKVKKERNFQHIADRDYFKASVCSALESIRVNQISKIVLASTIEVSSNNPFHQIDSLNNLRQFHPDCYIFSTSNGQGKNFIGASPERLIKIQNKELETDALAGSAPRGKTAAEDAYFADGLLSSEKERHEHQVVSNFIVNSLSKLGLNPQRLPLPCLLQLSNIQHLWTPIRAKVPGKVHPLEIVAELHPTPAVAGVPRNIALEQIRRYENFDRCLYAAPLGWIDHRGNSEFIVGIRSALIDGCSARLYAGAGIVAGSAPDKELAEIQLKFQPLLKALI
ncbi:isochorismate synthase [Microseira wollei]|uniref:isochorismate synthase n=1 Tax=Microseira wollei NIES-4236 TaxID=2530354 RepID=A0AAV3XSP6_9CYAN|nr:isochorismate synthase [Microseira wollei]GET44445.1 isochorismate synthases [Microseira wollei NIES-4236]